MESLKEMISLSKYIVVTGGVVSSIGKGITSASIGRILDHMVWMLQQSRSYTLTWDSGI